jgi:glycine/D-amino acid oxidase-like deaminating enzyme
MSERGRSFVAHIAVIGAGITSITTAFTLLDRGHTAAQRGAAAGKGAKRRA